MKFFTRNGVVHPMYYADKRVYVVIGSQERHWKHPERVKQYVRDRLDELIPEPKEAQVVSGESPMGGPDVWSHEWASDRGADFLPFDPEEPPYREMGSPAKFHARNSDMVEYAREHDGPVIAFWNGNPVRSGTKSTLDKAEKAGVKTVIFNSQELGFDSDDGRSKAS